MSASLVDGPKLTRITVLAMSSATPIADNTRLGFMLPDEQALPRGREKIARDMAMARLAAEIHLRSERYAKRPKRKFVSASTTEYAWATYLSDWVKRVEPLTDG